jgi:hypothetical protein
VRGQHASREPSNRAFNRHAPVAFLQDVVDDNVCREQRVLPEAQTCVKILARAPGTQWLTRSTGVHRACESCKKRRKRCSHTFDGEEVSLAPHRTAWTTHFSNAIARTEALPKADTYPIQPQTLMPMRQTDTMPMTPEDLVLTRTAVMATLTPQWHRRPKAPWRTRMLRKHRQTSWAT